MRTSDWTTWGARAAALALSVLAAGCYAATPPTPGEEAPGAGGAPAAARRKAPPPSLDPSCTNVGDFTVHNAGYPAHEAGKCSSVAGFTLADAAAACGGDVQYFSYTCTDFPPGHSSQHQHEVAWTASYGCCACTETSCTGGQICGGGGVPGVCACPQFEVLCDGQCANLGFDNDNCGACGNACPAGDTCIMGECSGCNATTCPAPGVCEGEICTTGCDPATCLPPHGCRDGYECILCTAPSVLCEGGACAYLDGDPNNCGACGNACPMGDICVMGACVSSCVPQTCAGFGFDCGPVNDGCGGVLQCGDCAAPQTCGGGGVGNVCGGGQTCQDLGGGCMSDDACCPMLSCQAGACQLACAPGLTACMGCVDLQSDPFNCGMCFNTCPMGSACVMGACH